MKLKIFRCLFAALMLCSIGGCKKQQDEFLATVPSESLSVAKDLNDLYLLLDNSSILNNNNPGIQELSADDYYITPANYLRASTIPDQNAYTWQKDIYPNRSVNDWNAPYSKIYYANTVLDALATGLIQNTDQNLYNDIKGRALFFRAMSYYNLLQLFAAPYNSSTATTDLGIPLRLTSDITIKEGRSSVQKCYDQVIQDLQNAYALLPKTNTYVTHPTTTSAMAFLSRVYLTMGNYSEALKAANTALTLNSSLVDFNTMTPTPLKLTNASQFPLSETSYITTFVSYAEVLQSRAIPDSSLYRSYDNNDLRRTFFFQLSAGQLAFTGNYNLKTGNYFDGVANDEVYLNRAECFARQGDATSAIADLNTLLKKRYLTGTFVPRVASSADDALGQILLERRKELIFRGTRWTDLRRLNRDSRFQTTLTRNINGTIYTLPPNDPRYVFAIPDLEVQLGGLQQNVR